MANLDFSSVTKKLTQSQVGGSQTHYQQKTDDSTSIFGNEFKSWINGTDKVCEDGQDDGKLSWKETAEAFGKGFCGIIKTAINHPIATGLAVAGGVALTVATGGAAAPVLCAIGATIGAGTMAYGGYKAATAETDAEAKQAWETIGNGTFGVAASVFSAKSALDGASKAGVIADKADDLNALQATAECFKVAPKALGASAKNLANNAVNVLNPGVVNINGSKTLVNGESVQSATDGIKVLTQKIENTSSFPNSVDVKKVPTSSISTAINGSSLDDVTSSKIISSLTQFEQTTMQDWGTWNSLGDIKFVNGSNNIHISNACGSGEALGILSQNVSVKSKSLS